MKNKLLILGMATVFSLGLAGCNSAEETANSAEVSEVKKEVSDTQTITYLGKEYTLPSEVNSIATASLESMEDAALLGVKPVGAITTGGKLPEYVAEELAGAESIGEKHQPSYETLLQLKPDVILGTSKFSEDIVGQLNKVATTVPVSHISTDWEDNLRLMAQLSGKEAEADQIIGDYKENANTLKEELSATLTDKKVIIIRYRGGSLNIYPENVYFNSIIYQDLGLAVPEEIKAAKAQEQITLEKLVEINPDYIFLQFEESGDSEKQQAFEELQKNAIWKSIEAVKNEQVFVNAVNPMAQGGTAWSKTAFLSALKDNLTQ